ncbi:VWA domain-containing protein [Dulcicalothrix desertica]|nr:VWA domain-containing protein [Dulcicalothrix desertica]TWH55391.1 von Willebrand factor type A domain-containing protein [Dulcicalothrix desertica PCC 7102]
MKRIFIDLSTIIASLTRKVSLSMLMVAAVTFPGQAQVAEIVGNPTVNDDRVTVRVKVKDAEEKPVMGLQDTNFKLSVDSKEVQFKNKDWKSPEESTPPPAWIIVLLDFSGSMDKPDSRGTKKIEGAIKAIRHFTNMLKERGENTQIALVPFGEPGTTCQGNPVNEETIDKFFPANDFKLQNNLDYLASLTPCASTNLYNPLQKTVRFLANTKDPRFYIPEDSSQPKPRLSIILLSDGYHNASNEEQDFQELTNLLKRNSHIIVHTLGYGLTPRQLGIKYGIGRAVTRRDIGTGRGKVPEAEFVDKQRLAEIAKLTGGIAEFSGDSEAIAENLQLFLNALLGEYEITYTQPDAERGAKHKVKVTVTYKDGQQIESLPKGYTITVFGRSFPLSIRLGILICTLLLLSLGGVAPFYFWGKHLKNQALGD